LFRIVSFTRNRSAQQLLSPTIIGADEVSRLLPTLESLAIFVVAPVVPYVTAQKVTFVIIFVRVFVPNEVEMSP
jgi:hypothetical protein